MKQSRVGRLSIVLVLLAGAGAALVFHQQLVDWWQLRNYTPPAGVAQLADQDQMTADGRRIFYVAHPAIEDSVAFNQHCRSHSEKTIVLGCYNGQSIYVYNVNNAQLDGVKEVTAAHEMLHAAYARLSKNDRTTVNHELEAQLQQIQDPRINDLVAQYKKSEPGQLDNELHSILGTEVTNLSPALEHHYQAYFRSRRVVADFAARYQSVFTKSEQEIAQIDGQLTDMRGTIQADEAALKQQRADLQTSADQLQQLRSSNQIAAYNAAVAPYNDKVNQYNSRLADAKQLIAQYNQLVARRNSLATAHNNLAQSLNSNLAPAPTQ